MGLNKNLKKNRRRIVELVIIISILLMGAFLRLYKIRDYMTFLGDEGRDVMVVRNLLVNFDIPFIGPTASVGGFFLGPIYYYFMTPFLWLFRFDPVGPAVMVALFGVATIWLIYIFGKELFGRKAGMIACLLYAIAPLVIAQSRSSWNPNIVPFFSLLLMYSLWKSVHTKKSKWFFMLGISLGIGIQLHYLFAFLFPVVVVFYLLYYRNKTYIKNYFLVIIGLLLPLIPFFGFEVKNNFTNARSFIAFITAGKEVAVNNNVVEKILDLIYRLYARLVFFYPPPEQISAGVKKEWIPLWGAVVILTIVLSLGLLIFKVFSKKGKQEVLMVLWFIFGIGLFIFYTRTIYDYYFVILFTWPFLIVGFLLSFLWNSKWLRPLLLIGFFGIFLLNINGHPFQYAPNRQVNQTMLAAKAVYDLAQDNPYNFALLTIQNSDHAYRYFLEVWDNPPTTIYNSQIDPERKSVTKQLIVLCEYSDCSPLGNSLWEIAGFGQADIVSRVESGPLVVYKLVPYSSNVIK